MHCEAVVEKAYEARGPADRQLPIESRIRLGETAHMLFGGFWGIVFAILLRDRDIRPWSQGAKLGTVLWLERSPDIFRPFASPGRCGRWASIGQAARGSRT